MKKAVISLSGGMDSTGLLVRLLSEGYEVYALSFYYGQKHRVELTRANKNAEYLKTKGYKVHQMVSDISGAMSVTLPYEIGIVCFMASLIISEV